MSLLEQLTHPMRNLRYYLLIFVATVFLIYWGPIPTILGGVSDDALFYPKIASNLVDGYGSTFDRLQPTNGYHPLWILIRARLSVSGRFGRSNAGGFNLVMEGMHLEVEPIESFGSEYHLYRPLCRPAE